MSTTISVSEYTLSDVLNVNGYVIQRTGLIANSNDSFDFTAEDFITGTLTADFIAASGGVGFTYAVTVQNMSDTYFISLTAPGTGMSLNPTAPTGVFIPPRGNQQFVFVITSIDSGSEAVEIQTVTQRTLTGVASTPTNRSISVFDTSFSANNAITSTEVSIDTEDNITGAKTLQLAGLTGATTLGNSSTTGAVTFNFPPNNGSNLNVLQTDGLGNSSWAPLIDANSLLFSYGPTAAFALTSTWTKITDWIASTVNDTSAYTLNTPSNGTITILVTGVYEIAFWAQFESDGGPNASGAGGVRVTRNGTAVTGSNCAAFVTRATQNQNQSGSGKTILLDATANDTLEVQVALITTTLNVQVIPSQSSVTITRLR